MKYTKKNGAAIIGGVVISAIVLCSSYASAAVACRNVTIQDFGMRPSIGSDPQSYYVRLKCSSAWTDEKTYFLSTAIGDSGYATLLTAVSLQKNITAWMDSYDFGSLITDIVVENGI